MMCDIRPRWDGYPTAEHPVAAHYLVPLHGAPRNAHYLPYSIYRFSYDLLGKNDI
jgi:hypothetical protein